MADFRYLNLGAHVTFVEEQSGHVKTATDLVESQLVMTTTIDHVPRLCRIVYQLC